MAQLDDMIARMGAQASLPAREFILQLLGALAASSSLAWLYVRYGRSLANRRSLAALFVPLTLTTMFVIAVVKSSLALSLGLVGALSIVRFRTAIREPEELIFLFICIGLGLGFGANQWVIVSVAFAVLAAVLFVTSKLGSRIDRVGSSWVLVQAPRDAKITVADMTRAVEAATKRARLTRCDAGDARIEAAYDVEMPAHPDALAKLIDGTRALAPGVRCLVVDQPARPRE